MRGKGVEARRCSSVPPLRRGRGGMRENPNAVTPSHPRASVSQPPRASASHPPLTLSRAPNHPHTPQPTRSSRRGPEIPTFVSNSGPRASAISGPSPPARRNVVPLLVHRGHPAARARRLRGHRELVPLLHLDLEAALPLRLPRQAERPRPRTCPPLRGAPARPGPPDAPPGPRSGHPSSRGRRRRARRPAGVRGRRERGPADRS